MSIATNPPDLAGHDAVDVVPRDPEPTRDHREAPSFGQPITTVSRSAVERESGSSHSVGAGAGLDALRAICVPAVLDEDLDRAGRDVENHVGDVPEKGRAEDPDEEFAVGLGPKYWRPARAEGHPRGMSDTES
jgi:hypothetical protein